MARLFKLEILTPERQFFSDNVEDVIITLPDGKYGILGGHVPLIAPLVIGVIQIKMSDGNWKELVNSEGFVQVRLEGVKIYLQACEWPEEIDLHRAEEAKHRAEERLRQHQSLKEYRQSKIALARAMARLRVTKANNDE